MTTENTLPKEWQELSFDDVAEFINGRAFKPSEWTKEGLPIIRIQNLTDESKKFNFYNGDFDKKYLVKKGDVLISWSASIGVFIWNGKDAILNQHIFKVNPKPVVDKQYFVYAATRKIDELKHHTHGSTMKHITKGPFLKTTIPVPPLEKQKQITKILDSIKSMMQKRKRVIELHKQLIPSIFVHMFGDPITNPKSWKTAKLPKVATVKRGKFTHRPRDDPDFFGGTIPWIQVNDITNADYDYVIRNYKTTLNEKGLHVSKVFPRGTIVLSIAASIGEVAILGFDGAFPDSIVGITPLSMPSKFLFYQLILKQHQIDNLSMFGTQKNINLEILSKVDIIIPDSELIEKFINIAESVEVNQQRNFEYYSSLSELFSSISSKIFNGELIK